MSEKMPPVHSAPATTSLVPVAVFPPPPRQSLSGSAGAGECSSSENSDNSDSGSSSPRASGSEDGGSSCGGPPPLLSQNAVSDPLPSAVAEKVAICDSSLGPHSTERPLPAGAIPLSVVHTTNKDPVLTTALLPHCESPHTQLASSLGPSCAWLLRRCIMVCVYIQPRPVCQWAREERPLFCPRRPWPASQLRRDSTKSSSPTLKVLT